MAKYRLRRKSFGAGVGNLLGTVAKKTWNSGIGKTAIIGGGIATAGAAYGGAKYLGASKDALTGDMGKEDGAGY